MTQWIQNDRDQNLQNIIETISRDSSQIRNQKRKIFSEDNDYDSHCIRPSAKRIKLDHSNHHHNLERVPQQIYEKIIHLLNCGKISYSYSKKQIRKVLAKEYNLNDKALKKNKEFNDGINRLIDSLNLDGDQHHTSHNSNNVKTTANNTSNNIKRSKPRIVSELKTLRDCKAALSSKSGGCSVHSIGHHIAFKQDGLCLYMICSLCQNQEIARVRLPTHLRTNTMNTLTNTNHEEMPALEKDECEVEVTKKGLGEWDCNDIVYWMNEVGDGILNDIKYTNVKKQIIIGNIKGDELKNINDTTLKLIGIEKIKDRELLLKYLLDLTSQSDDVSE